MKKTLLLLATIFSIITLNAEDEAKRRIMNLSKDIDDFDNYYFAVYYFNNKNTGAYNAKNFPVNEVVQDIKELKVNPNGSNALFYTMKKKKERLYIYDLHTINELQHKFDKELVDISSICYSKDSKTLYISNGVGQAHSFDAKTYSEGSVLDLKLTNPKMMTVSFNNYFLAAANGNIVNVLSIEKNIVRKSLVFEHNVVAIDFSYDNKMLAVATTNEEICIYDTKTFEVKKIIKNAGQARDCHFHPENKYIAFFPSENKLTFVNILNDIERHDMEYENNVKNMHIFRFEPDNKTYSIFNSDKEIIMQEINCVTPYYNQLIDDELNDRMNVWLKRMDDETLDDYNKRVNDDTRAEYMRQLRQELAAQYGNNLIDESEVIVGDYTQESNSLKIDFSNMPSIELDVPKEDAAAFLDADNLEFQNAKYILGDADDFELVYADVFNKENNKTYVYDKYKEEEPEEEPEEEQISMELIKQVNEEVEKLEEIKKEIVAKAMNENIISNHTNINVDANLESSNDAEGNDITNYAIDFSYEVEKEFSAAEDFAAGKYLPEQSGAASSMIKVISEALTNNFEQYIQPGKKLKLLLTGSADASPIRGRIAYKDGYGDLINEPVYENGAISNISVRQQDGITRNEQLAFLRAWGVKELILEQTPDLQNMDVEIDINIQVSKDKGSQARRIEVKFVFVDTFAE